MPAAKEAGNGASTSKQDGDIDVKSMSEDKIKQLMRSDPKFISRLISQLDKNMGVMVKQKAKRLEANAVLQKEIDQINDTMKTHIQPNVARLETSIREKTAQREHLAKQVDVEFDNVKALEAEARALIQRSRHTAGRLMRNTASQRLEEHRGFSAAIPTTTLIKAATTKRPV